MKFKDEAERLRADSAEKIEMINEDIKSNNFKLTKSDGFDKKPTTFRVNPNSKSPIEKLNCK